MVPSLQAYRNPITSVFRQKHPISNIVHLSPGLHGRSITARRTLTSSSTSHKDDLLGAQSALSETGLDPASFWEQRIVWGDQDPFQHVNNVRYARFFESARIKWMMSIGEEWGGSYQAESMIRGQGVSLILKTMEIQFRRPVTFPDTLLLGYAPLPPTTDDDTSFQVVASAYSLSMKKFVAHSRETLVWYDYDRLRKCSPPKEAAQIISARIRTVPTKP